MSFVLYAACLRVPQGMNIAFLLIVLTFSSFCNRFCLTHSGVSSAFSPRAGGFPTVCMPFFLLLFYMLMLNRLIKTFPGGFLAGWSLFLLWLALVIGILCWICKVKSRK